MIKTLKSKELYIINRKLQGVLKLLLIKCPLLVTLPVILLQSSFSNAQDSLLPATTLITTREDTLKRYTPGDYIIPLNLTPEQRKKRVRLVAAGNILGYGGTMVALYKDWYSKYPQSGFHTFNDNHEWKQVDKVGHAYSAYVESNGSMELWRWAGLNRKQRIWIGGLSGIAYQTIIETLDGFSSEWGWSWGDMGANVFGSGMVIGQELAWNDQRVKMKFSFHKKNYGSQQLNARANDLYGKSFSERMIKDYNGQTYWLSANLKSFFPKSNLPPWLNVAVGYGAEGMFGANENVGRDDLGNITFDRRDLSRYRQFYIAPDFDLTKIKTRSYLLKIALIALNSFKFPAPSLEYNSQGKLAFHFIHF